LTIATRLNTGGLPSTNAQKAMHQNLVRRLHLRLSCSLAAPKANAEVTHSGASIL
jgi:hypothetical protein